MGNATTLTMRDATAAHKEQREIHTGALAIVCVGRLCGRPSSLSKASRACRGKKRWPLLAAGHDNFKQAQKGAGIPATHSKPQSPQDKQHRPSQPGSTRSRTPRIINKQQPQQQQQQTTAAADAAVVLLAAVQAARSRQRQHSH